MYRIKFLIQTQIQYRFGFGSGSTLKTQTHFTFCTFYWTPPIKIVFPPIFSFLCRQFNLSLLQIARQKQHGSILTIQKEASPLAQRPPPDQLPARRQLLRPQEHTARMRHPIRQLRVRVARNRNPHVALNLCGRQDAQVAHLHRLHQHPLHIQQGSSSSSSK